MSNNLGIPQMTTGQAAPEVGVNNASGAIDAALTLTFTANASGGNVTVTAAQYQGAGRIFVTGVSVARNITLPAVQRAMLIEVDSTNTNVATIVVGSTSIATVAGNTYIAYTDGTTNGLKLYAVGNGSGISEDVAVFQSGVMTNAQELLRFNVIRSFTLPVSLTGSAATAGVAATASTTLTLKQNGSSIGTLVWAISGTTASITFASAVTFAVGDVLTIDGPATADATLANIAINLKGSR